MERSGRRGGRCDERLNRRESCAICGARVVEVLRDGRGTNVDPKVIGNHENRQGMIPGHAFRRVVSEAKSAVSDQ